MQSDCRDVVNVAEFTYMFRSVSFAALVLSLALDASAPVGVAARSDSDTSVAAKSSIASLSALDDRSISESSVLLIIGFALISVSRAARR